MKKNSWIVRLWDRFITSDLMVILISAIMILTIFSVLGVITTACIKLIFMMLGV